jgi:hypothetical protein
MLPHLAIFSSGQDTVSGLLLMQAAGTDGSDQTFFSIYTKGN